MNRFVAKLSFIAVVTWGLVMATSLALPRAQAQDVTPEATMSATDDASFTGDNVKQAAALLKARGHLMAASALWEAKDYPLAATHAGHAQAEVAAIQGELKGASADTALTSALEAFAGVAGQNGDAAIFKDTNQKALDALTTASEALLNDLNDNTQFKGAVILSLVNTAEHEYEEALEDGKIVEAIEYQDAVAFVTAAEELWNEILPTLPDPKAHEVEEVQEYLGVLKAAFPDFIKQPDPITTYEDVEHAVREIDEYLGVLLDLPEIEGAEGEVMVQTVLEMVEQAVEEYENGETEESYEIAANAYLEGFEYLEADLLKQDKELVETLEIQFKDLRDAIKAGKSVTEVEAIAEKIEDNLNKAAKLLEAH